MPFAWTSAPLLVSQTLKTAVVTFGVNINNLLVFLFGKKVIIPTESCKKVTWSESVARSLCFPIMPLYSGFIKKSCPSCSICPISDALCTLCPLCPDWCAILCFLGTGDIGMSWLAFVPDTLTHLWWQQSVCKPHHQSARARAETDQFTPLQLSLWPFGLSSNWT